LKIKHYDLMSNTSETHLIRTAINSSKIFINSYNRKSKYVSIIDYKNEMYLLQYTLLKDIDLIDIKLDINYFIKVKDISELNYKESKLFFFNEKEMTVDVIGLYEEDLFEIYVGLKRYMKKQEKEEL